MGAAGGDFKTPLRWLLDATRLLADGRSVREPALLQRWLASLGQGLFARATPDGYPLEGRAWLNAGQLTQRFAVARALVGAQSRLFGGSGGAMATTSDEPGVAAPTPERLRTPADLWATPAVQNASSALTPAQRAVVMAGPNPFERLGLLLASPALMYS